MDSICSRSNVLDDLESPREVPFSELALRNPPQIDLSTSPQKIHCANEEGSFANSSENDSYTDINKVSPLQSTSDIIHENKSTEESPSTMEKISMLLGAHFPEDSKLLANPKGIIKSYLSVAAANDPDKFDSYRKLCMAHVNEYYKHLKGDSGALCLVCNIPCQHWNTLQRHLQTHINFRPFSCELCGRTFYSQSKLKRHQVIHNDIKPYKCPVCERRLGRPEHLKRHLLVHTDSKPFGCSGCSHTTKRLDGIRRHIKRKHGTDGATIVEIVVPYDSQVHIDVQQTVAQADDVLPVPMKVKRKKKKKKSVQVGVPGTSTSLQQDALESKNALTTTEQLPIKCALDGSDTIQQDVKSDMSDITRSYGAHDLRLLPNGCDGNFSSDVNAIKSSKERFPSCSQKLSHTSSDKPSCRLLVPSHPMQLLYQKLARSTPNSEDIARNDANSLRNSNNNQSFSAELRNPSQPEIFSVNSMPPDQQRYLPSSGNSAPPDNSRHVNSMLLAPSPANPSLGHYSHPPDLSALPAEMMISQYFQSHQRFAPPVWGFANPNYPNY